MGASLTLFRIHGIQVRVHWSFLLILVYGAFVYGGDGESRVISALYGVFVTLLLFLCVTLHEFGHAVVAKLYGIGVPNITLLPIGGLASLDRMPEKPSQEFSIALAGPAVNVVLALLLLPVAWVTIGIQLGFSTSFPPLYLLRRGMLEPGFLNLLIFLISTNLLLAFFNLLPAFPMDGGRILRALLAMVFSYVTATRVAVIVGRIMAILFAVAGIAGTVNGGSGFFLLFIAFFVYVGGGAERDAVEHRMALRGIPVSRALTADAVHLFTSERIGRAVDLVMLSKQTFFAVLDLSGNFVGVLTRQSLVRGLQERGQDVRIVDVMIPADRVPVSSDDVDLATVWERMSRAGSRVIVIEDGPLFKGLITADDITAVIHQAKATASDRSRTFPGKSTSSSSEVDPNARV